MEKFSGNSILIGTILLLTLSTTLYGCGGGGKKEDTTEKGKEEKQAMKLTSKAFESGESIPAKYTCTGEDISPPLRIENVDPKAKSLVLIVDDPDAPAGVFDHWLLWNIPPDTHQIPEGIAQKERVDELDGAVQGKNDFGKLGYRGPCPPKGSTKDKLEKALKGLVIEEAVLTEVYSR